MEIEYYTVLRAAKEWLRENSRMGSPIHTEDAEALLTLIREQRALAISDAKPGIVRRAKIEALKWAMNEAYETGRHYNCVDWQLIYKIVNSIQAKTTRLEKEQE